MKKCKECFHWKPFMTKPDWGDCTLLNSGEGEQAVIYVEDCRCGGDLEVETQEDFSCALWEEKVHSGSIVKEPSFNRRR